uniref:NME/NM23 family member 5 [Ovis aries] n=1 Tax=Lepeophtheirus salmonis TaxID=72036 RepID=A0A0K2T6C6_LEPSM
MFKFFESNLKGKREDKKSGNKSSSSLEGTFAIIKPDAFHKREEIVQILRTEGFLLVAVRVFTFSKLTLAKCFGLNSLRGHEDFVDFMTSGKVLGICLARKDGIRKLQKLAGPKNSVEAKMYYPRSIRALYGKDELRNAIHVSDDAIGTEREIGTVFPTILYGDEAYDEIVVADENTKEDLNETLRKSVNEETLDNKEYLMKYVCPTLLKGLNEMYDKKPENPVIWLATWLIQNNPKNHS